MYLGQIVEVGAIPYVLDSPRHSYTQLLMKSIPRMGIELDSPLVNTELPETGNCLREVVSASVIQWTVRHANYRNLYGHKIKNS
ncbi:hypothetical protein L2C91_13545 [Rosenbergiella epipactidis]|nr:hypothetical protein [Rosenbergiella epipactidis]MCL9669390.1 hypothetical protein [Rosenbergiella epipactidis]